MSSKPVTYDAVIVDDEDIVADDTAYNDKYRAFNEAMHEVGNEAVVEIWRVKNTSINPNTPEGRSAVNNDFCDTYPVDLFDFSALHVHVKNNFGPGIYRIYLKHKGKIKNNVLITIATPKAAPPAPARSPFSGGGELSELARILVENQRASDERFAALLATMKREDKDPRAEMLANLGLMREMREAFGITAPTAPADPVDPIQALVKTVESFATLRGLMGEFGGGTPAGDPDSVITVLKDVLPEGLKLWRDSQQIKAAELTLATATRVPNPAPRQNATNGPGSAPLPPEAVKLFEQLDAAAQADHDVDEVARQLIGLEVLRENFRKNILTAPKPFKALLNLWPNALDNPGWYADLLDAMADELATFDAGAEQAQTSGGANSMPPGENNATGPDDLSGNT